MLLQPPGQPFFPASDFERVQIGAVSDGRA